MADPLYVTIVDSLKQWMHGQTAGAALPTERELVQRFGLSRATIRRAIDELSREGLVYRRQGSGTFVAGSRLETQLNQIEGFTHAALASGRRPETIVLGISRVSATSDITSVLQGGEAWKIERIRLLDGIPAMVETAYLPTSLFPKLNERDISGSLYDLMNKWYGQIPAKGRERVFAISADAKLAHLLHLPISSPLLASIRTAANQAGQPIEHTLRHIRPDLCGFTVDLTEGQSLVVHATPNAFNQLEGNPI